MVASVALLLAAFRLWPLPSGDEDDARVYTLAPQEIIAMEEIVQTEQAKRKPPPPPPYIPVVLPEEIILEEYDYDLSENFLDIDEPGDAEELVEGEDVAANASLPVARTSPKPVRFVEPDHPRAAQRRRIRAEVVVEVLVNIRGRVDEAKVVDRYLLDKDENRERVDELGYGLEEAALAAAERYMFRPARENGKAVSSLYPITITFGL